MSDTSISSSPSRSDVTIYTTRLKRRNKRSNIDLSAQLNCDQKENPNFFHNLLAGFYNNSEVETAKTSAQENNNENPFLENPAILSNFKPFEFEKSFAIADHIFVQEINQTRPNSFSETQGFVTCTNLSQANSKNEKDSQNDSFIITETELISCCYQAEKIFENNDDSKEQDIEHHESTPKKDNMTLVNSILEDFSQSPLNREQIINNFSCQYTPEFRLRRLPVKTYCRKHIKSKRTNLLQRFETPNTRQSSDYDENISCSSLSVQEDDIFCENTNSESVATNLNNTERLCENLLNLTEYFTQNELIQSFEEDRSRGDFHSTTNSDINTNLSKISDLLNNILILRSNCSNELHDDSYDSSNDFNGFANSEFKMDDTLLEEWNEDNCHDIFACIDTETVLQQYNIRNPNNISTDDLTSNSRSNNQTFIVPNDSLIKPPAGDFIAFKSKPIEVAEEANIMTSKVLSISCHIPDFTGNDPLPKSDNKALDKDLNIFENPEDYEWNDDCDLFLNFQTPISFEEKILTNSRQKVQRNQDAPTTSKLSNTGFTTAGGKTVDITSKGQAIALKLLKEFAGEINDNKNYEEELKEIKFKVYAKNLNLKTKESSLNGNKDQTSQITRAAQFSMSTEQNLNVSKNVEESIHIPCKEFLTGFKSLDNVAHQQYNPLLFEKHSNMGFYTANGKNVSISRKARETVATLLNDFNTDVNIEKELKDFKTKIQIKNKELKAKPNQYTKNDEYFVKHPILDVTNTNKGFQTANGKEVSISAEAKEAVDILLKEFDTELDIETCEKNLKYLKAKVQIKNKDLKAKPSQYRKNDECFGEPLLLTDHNMQLNQLNADTNKGFQTANGNGISISVKAKQAAEILLKECNTDLNIETCEKDLKAKVCTKNKDIELKTFSQEFGKDVRQNSNENMNINQRSSQLDDDFTNFALHKTLNNPFSDLTTGMDAGFQTANGKQVTISPRAKQAVENNFKEFDTFADVETSAKYLKDIKTEIHNKNKGPQAKCLSRTFNEPPSDDNLGPKLTNCKRKLSIENSEIEPPNKTPAVKIFKNDLQPSKSSLAEQSLKSPLMSATRTIIVRKNLLSLTKKRKNKMNTLNKATEYTTETNKYSNDCAATPTKSFVTAKPKELDAETPNLKEFLTNASLTSTPRINKTQNVSHSFDDSDLIPIIWKNDSSLCYKSETDTSCVTKLSENSSSNISFNSSNPTAKERIGRLKMYGNAPDVSQIPIETNHNCRPSGLRRTRSLLKKFEN